MCAHNAFFHPRWKTLLAFLAVLGASGAWAQSPGTTTADILKINNGIRPSAMGGAYTAIGDDLYSVNYNPAGISYIKATQLVIYHLDSIADIEYEYLAFGTAWGLGNALAANLIYEHMPPIDNQNGNPAVNADDLLGSLSYAGKFGDNFRLGATVKLLYSNLAGFSATALAFDAGAILDRLPYGMKVGLSIQNVGTSMTFDPADSTSDSLPIYIRLGVGTHQVIDNDKDLDFDVDLIKPSTQGSSLLDQGLQLALGGEYWVFPRLFAVRAGFDLQNIGALYGGTDALGNSAPGVANAFDNYTLGCTLTRSFEDCDLSVDIAYDPANFTSTTQDTFSFGLYFNFSQLRLL